MFAQERAEAPAVIPCPLNMRLRDHVINLIVMHLQIRKILRDQSSIERTQQHISLFATVKSVPDPPQTHVKMTDLLEYLSSKKEAVRVSAF